MAGREEVVSLHYYEDEDGWGFQARKKFPSGMTGVLQFQALDCLTDGTRCWNVNLDLKRKRKRDSAHRAVTGEDGLEPASWVLQLMGEAEAGLKRAEPGWPFRIEVTAVDDRRFRLYKRVLTRRGYSVTMVENQRTLVKRIDT